MLELTRNIVHREQEFSFSPLQHPLISKPFSTLSKHFKMFLGRSIV